MMRCFSSREGRLVEVAAGPGGLPPLQDVIWIDLIHPSRAEEDRVEAALGLGIPTREDMAEIEASSRLYAENGATYMTASLLSRPATDMTAAAQEGVVTALPVSFVLTDRLLVTVRYHEPRSFHIFQNRAEKGDAICHGPGAVLVGLFEVIVDRLADIAEDAGREIDAIAAQVRDPRMRSSGAGRGLDRVLERIGAAEDLTGKLAASTGTLDRLVTGMSGMAQTDTHKDTRTRLKIMTRDLQSVTDYVERQALRVTFLLEFTLGRINMEQNGIIKIFSVMSVIFLPPTLIASVYGMNFTFMPELAKPLGYPLAIGAMLLSAVLPYLYFRRRGWL